MKKGMTVVIYAIWLFFLTAPDVFAQEAGKVDAGDTAFVLLSASLVMLMTPGLALFTAVWSGAKMSSEQSCRVLSRLQ